MEELKILAQLTVAISVLYVWIFRFHNVLKEFKQFGLSDLIRNFIGVSKTSLATLMIAGIWYPSLVLIPSLLMAFIMLSAQLFHIRAKNPLVQRMPSIVFFALSIFIVIAST